MATGKVSPILENVRGAIGDLVIKQYGSKVVMTRRPVFRNRVFSEAQKARQEKFRHATAYAAALMADPQARSMYEQEARAKGRTAKGLMMSDFLNA